MFKITYDFYANEYGGTAVDENSFPRYQTRASVTLDRLTFGHVVEEDGEYGQNVRGNFLPFTEEELELLSFAVCSLIDATKELDDLRANALAGGESEANVKSRSSGGESITYESRKTAWDDALNDENARMNLMRNVALETCDPFAFRWNPFYAGLESRWS